jgi:biotin transport system ATP-binding protein
VRLHKAGHTIVLVTHELEKALAHADRLVIIHKGKLAEDGRPEDVIHNSEAYGVRMPLKDGEGVGRMTWLA